jgi:hypothetical protein
LGNYPFLDEHIAFDKRASFLQVPIKLGKFPKIWESSHLLLNT